MVQNGQSARVGFCSDRLGVIPTEHILAAVGIAFLLMLLTTTALAMRAKRPLKTLCSAFDTVSKGQIPELKPSNIKELDQFIEHFNHMSQQVCSMLDNRTTLLGGISHDLRTPLTRMRLSLELLSQHCDNKLVGRMIHDVEQMNEMIDESVRLTRALEPGKRESMDLVELVKQVIGLHEEEHARIQLTHPHSCVREIHGAALKRILLNLLQNALRYSGQHKVHVFLDCGFDSSLIEVADRGSGIPADQREAIFRPFYRLEQSRNNETGGSGLGLAIAVQLAEANGCHIEYEDREGGGSIFRIIITHTNNSQKK
ncbi:MAG: hypothetical protein KZQ58_10330 [gamma proteobacterium symbiont of Bathyaustriella thionipta]|nr:hypothetical protein [gamma proteobacterium symbiont of Bathyaustriella thionipta]